MAASNPPEIRHLLASPRLPVYLEFILRFLEKEAVRRDEFYRVMTDEHKMEFINGETVMHPGHRDCHIVTQRNTMLLLRNFVSLHQLGAVHSGKCLCVFPRNDYEPDVVFFGPEKAAKLRPDTLKFPAPDFVAEVLSESTEARDRGVKFEDYQAHGVKEYWILDPETQVAEQYVLNDGAFVLRTKSASGELISEAVPGFRIPVAALFDAAANLAALRGMFPSA